MSGIITSHSTRSNSLLSRSARPSRPESARVTFALAPSMRAMRAPMSGSSSMTKTRTGELETMACVGVFPVRTRTAPVAAGKMT
jgi:hypothetical protein